MSVCLESSDRLDVELKAYHREWWENPSRPDPRRAVYDALNRHVEGRIPDGAGGRALDLGCGRGTITGMLLRKGYQVTALDIDEAFVDEVRRRYPMATSRQADIRDLDLDGDYDLVTMIEVAQNLDAASLWRAVKEISAHCRRLFVNISNGNSAHALWIRLRGWQNPFVRTYTPEDLELALGAWHFRITHRKGIGLLTPVTLLRGFRGTLVPPWLATWVDSPMGMGMDGRLPRLCHLYYVEAEASA